MTNLPLLGLGRHEPERCVGNLEHVVFLRHDDGDIGRHAGLQTKVLIVHTDHDIVSDHVLHTDWSKPHLPDRPGKRDSGIGIDGEYRFLPFGNPADIRFADVRIDLHLGEIEGDQKKIRRREAGRHRLADFDVSGHDDTVHRRTNRRVFEI